MIRPRVQRIARWSLYLSDYNYKVKYLKGVDNSVADVLSRLVLVQKQRHPGSLPESMGSLACLFYRSCPSIRNSLEGSQDATGIEEPHERMEPP
eukprot:SAG11_NODE_1125_length_5773_cov_1.928974_2_plen_94_part_00